MRLKKNKIASIISANNQYKIIFESESELIDLVKRYILHFKEYSEIDIQAFNGLNGKVMNLYDVKEYAELESEFNSKNYMRLRRLNIIAYRKHAEHSHNISRNVISELFFENYFEYCLLICEKKTVKDIDLLNILCSIQ